MIVTRLALLLPASVITSLALFVLAFAGGGRAALWASLLLGAYP